MKKLFLLIVFAAALTNVIATSYTWNGGSSTWNTTTNWTPNGTPGTGDDVTINSASPITLTLGNATSVNTLSVSGGSAISFAGGTFGFTINSGLTFSGGTKISLTTQGAFTLGNGTATFSLSGNDASNYFTATSGNGYLAVNNNSSGSINLFVDPAITWYNFVVQKGTTVLKSNCLTNRLGLSSLNSQKLVLDNNVAFTLNGTGSSSLGANGSSTAGYVDASAPGSKFTFMGNGNAGASVFAGTNRIFANGATVNNLEMNTASIVLTPNTALKVNTLTLTAGNINNTTNNITVLNGGTIIRSNQNAFLAAAPIYGLSNTDKVNIQYGTTCTTGNELFGTMGSIGTITVNTGVTATLSNSSVTSIALTGTLTGFSNPTVTISAPANGVQATATCAVTGSAPNKTLLSVLITNPGYGYTSAPTITFNENSGLVTGTPSVMAQTGTTNIDALTIGSGTSGTVTYPNTSAKVVTLNVKDITVNNGSTFTCGTQTNNVTHLLNLGGTITKNGTGAFTTITTAGTKVVDVTMNGSAAQSGISSPVTFNNLTINNASGVNLGASPTVNGSLALTAGTLTVGANTLSLAGTAPTRTSGVIDASDASSIVSFTNTSAMTLPIGLFSGAIKTLTMNGAGGVTLSEGITISKALNLTSGALTNSQTNNITFDGGVTPVEITRSAGSISGTGAYYPVFTSLANVTYTNSSTISTGFEIAFDNAKTNNVTLTNANINLGAARTINGNLSLQSGVFSLGSLVLTYKGGSITRSTGTINASGASSGLTFGNTSALTLPTGLFGGTNVNALTVNGNGGSVILQEALTVNGATTVGTGATLAIGGGNLTTSGGATINGTFQLNQSSWASGGTWTYGAAGTLAFNNSTGSYDVNEDSFWPYTNGPVNVSVLGAGGITMKVGRNISGVFQTAAGVSNTFGNDLTVSGTVRLNAGGYFSNFSPIYTSTGTLEYNTGTSYSTSNEWIAGASAAYGVPQNVKVLNGTIVTPAGARTIPGILTLTNGNVVLGANDLTIGGSISGGSSSSYIVTDGAGKLNQSVGAGSATLFPVGISTSSYDPATVTPTDATAFSVRVSSTFTGASQSGSYYNSREWNLTPTTPSLTEISLTPSVLNDLVGAYNVIGHYDADNSYHNYNATKSGSTYTATLNVFSPFVTGTTDIATALNKGSILAKSNIYASNGGIVVENANGKSVSVYSLTGKKVYSANATSDRTSIAASKGIYIISVDNVKSKVLVK